jgi:hypothetical protein
MSTATTPQPLDAAANSLSRGNVSRRSLVLLLAIGAGTLAALAGCGDDDRYKPGGGYTFPGKGRDGKGFGGGSRV